MLAVPVFAKILNVFAPGADPLPSDSRSIVRDLLLGGALWFMSLLLLVAAEAPNELRVFWGTLAPVAILLHVLASRYLIPSSLGSSRPFWNYLLKTFLVLVGSVLPVGLVIVIITSNTDAAIAFNLFQVAFNLVVTAPLSWLVFRRRLRRHQAVTGLQQELGQSTANLDLLRSQINPHFLFNALNTLYGTALQENGERTAQGIQMLGDMMRFMLHENHQPRILLAREIEYLRNYIDLQSLRTATSPGISIDAHLLEVPAGVQIAPMLLIPFVENAFKHGISLQHKSWIKVTLHCEGHTLYFDVYNSTHERPAPGLADDASGIGLANVQQRLALLYPERHELLIRQTKEEYFVHLTVQL
ncbi:sensor histidine kinase [Hymenobacter busanensis]|uniref:Sensor histidine kinase n=1 Tax=Hymenobacter busanensis TaxID=2607656 RepID=A0A7L4ZS48_9BACT|nr:histidine kinase [Hymenobacter busanensis]KAA9327568.1 sensor histidine kinase [Hymenobacter busanensis]QHJ06094.1 sensor histidine kinase [Hymenobacter busanensis]